MHSQPNRGFVRTMALCLIVSGTIGSLAWGQPYFFSGSVKTPTNQPIAGATVWYTYYGSGALAGTGASCTTSAAGNYGDALSGYLPFMPGYYDIWLRVSKPGYEFRPLSVIYGNTNENPGYYWTKSQGPYSNTVRNFQGVSISDVTSGKIVWGAGGPGAWAYYGITIPPGATDCQVVYDGTGLAVIEGKFGDWPTGTPAPGSVPRLMGTPTHKSLIINASSTPAIQAGKLYLGVYGLEATTFTLKTVLHSSTPLPVISGRVTNYNGVTTTPLSGIRVYGDNGATSTTTNSNGQYQITTPYNWYGNVSVYYPSGRFLPLARGFSALTTNSINQDFSGPQYYLTINTPRGNPQGGGWYDSGKTASWTVTSPVADTSATRYAATIPYGNVVMDGPKTVTVGWQIQHLLTTSVNVTGYGTITPSGWYLPGESAKVSAAPASGYKFTGFSGASTATSSPVWLTMSGPKWITANFSPLVTPTPTPTPTPVPGQIRVPQDKNTIQKAIDAAQPGNVVVVSPNTYHENINMRGKNITVRSTDPTDPAVVAATVIDGTTSALVATVTFAGSELSTCTLSGFTITKGRGYFGGGINGNFNHATITHNVITKNSVAYNYADGSGQGGGIFRCNGLMQDNTVTSNTSEYYGGGISDCSGVVDRCVVAWNSAANNAGGFYNCDNTTISNCLIYENKAQIGGGLFFEDHGTVINCTIAKNHALSDWASWGGGIYNYYHKVALKNSIVWGNTGVILRPGEPSYYYQYYNPGTTYVSNTCIQNWGVTDNGCTSEDPKFVDAAHYNFQLASDSPCIDTGTTVGLKTDFRGVARPFNSKYDMGAYEYATMPAPDAPVMGVEPVLTAGSTNTVSWHVAPRAASYTVQIARYEEFDQPLGEIQIPVGLDGMTTYTATFTDLNDFVYWYRVRGENVYGNPGPWSSVVWSRQDSTAPWFTGLLANPSQAYSGNTVSISFSASEQLNTDPAVTLNGKSATLYSKLHYDYVYKYTVAASDTLGTVTLVLSASDPAGYTGAMTNKSALKFIQGPQPTPTPSPSPSPTFKITGLSPTGYALDRLMSGKVVYGDRTYTFKSPVPSSLYNQVYIKTLNADKDSTATSVKFTVNMPVTIVVAVSENMTTIPSWLAGWTKRADKLVTNDGTANRTLYEKRFSPGQITLGANREKTMPTGKSMYTVVIIPIKNQARNWRDYR